MDGKFLFFVFYMERLSGISRCLSVVMRDTAKPIRRFATGAEQVIAAGYLK
jgi:hypothetical protein